MFPPDRHHQVTYNRIWSRVLLEELTRLGVTDVCIAPGSRSTPLTLEAQLNHRLETHTHFDERGLGFLALGMAKESNRPVAVIVTSGTAVANLLPAVAESRLTGEKLIILSADRPQSLINCGANQAINQHGLFSTHVREAINLPSPSNEHSLNWLLTTVDHLLWKQRERGGSVHINCPFPEPLYGELDDVISTAWLKSLGEWSESNASYTSICSSAEQRVPDTFKQNPVIELNKYGKKVFIVGNVSSQESKLIKTLAEQQDALLLCDPQSGMSSRWSHYDLWLENSHAKPLINKAEVIVQFGARIVSKRLNGWIQSQVTSQGTPYVLVSSQQEVLNEHHLPQIQFCQTIDSWVHSYRVQESLNDKNNHLLGSHQTVLPWLDALSKYSEKIAQYCGNKSDSETLTELDVASCVGDVSSGPLFIGNSLIVRLVDMVGNLNGHEVFTNRGASGIDGLVATAAGVMRSNNRPLHLLLGDTSLLYDLNSLALFSKLSSSKGTPVVITVVNNDGGAIFDMLPVPEQQKQEFYQMPHGMDFQFAAKQFGLDYRHIKQMPEYRSTVRDHLSSGTGCLIVEVRTPYSEAGMLLKQLKHYVSTL